MLYKQLRKFGELIVVLAQHCRGGCSPLMQHALYLAVNQSRHRVTTDIADSRCHHGVYFLMCSSLHTVQQGALGIRREPTRRHRHGMSVVVKTYTVGLAIVKGLRGILLLTFQ